MAIPASHIVNVYPRVITPGSADLEMNGLLFGESELIPADKVLSFPSPRSVSDFFGPDSDEYAASVVYFQAYDNKFSSPKALLFARRVDVALPGRVVGAELTATLAELKLVTSGTLTVSAGAAQATVNGLNLSTAGSLSAVAVILQTAFETAELDVTVGFDSVTGGFVVASTEAGAGTDVSFDHDTSEAVVALGRQLGLRTDSGARLSPGMDALSFAAQMQLVMDQTQNWVSFTTIKPPADLELVLEMGRWASQNYGYLYVPWSTDPAMTNQLSESDMAARLKDEQCDHVAAVYGHLRHACFIMGGVASIPWLRLNGTITLAFKHQTGLEATVSNEARAVVLESKNCNYLGNFATRNADFRFLYPGVLSHSSYKFVDSYVNSIWLNSMLQRSILDGLNRAGRVPYTQRGYTMIRAWMIDPVLKALNNGAIESGVTLNESQKSELAAEAGRDISGELFGYGYCIQILDPGAEARYARETPIINLWYTYGGSVQRIEVASTAVL